MLAGVELGGTKVLCLVGTGPGDVREETRIPTTTPQETLDRVAAFLQSAAGRSGPLKALGIACFGPVDLRVGSPTFGHILSTPKAGWQGAEVAPVLARRLGVPVGLDTDVNGAALGEHRWGAGQGLRTLVYWTVGTGIGGGALVDGRPLHGLLHPEMGHLQVPRDPVRDPFSGCCPFHGDCLEGLASGTAIRARWGLPGQDLVARPEVWELIADYLAAGLAAVTLILSPERVILGGGVMETPGLLERVRRGLALRLGGYLQHLRTAGNLQDFLVPPALGSRSGALGALILAEEAVRNAG